MWKRRGLSVGVSTAKWGGEATRDGVEPVLEGFNGGGSTWESRPDSAAVLVCDDYESQRTSHFYEHSLTEHTLCVTDIVIGQGGYNAITVSASDDRTFLNSRTLFSNGLLSDKKASISIRSTIVNLHNMILALLPKIVQDSRSGAYHMEGYSEISCSSVIDAIVLDPAEHVFYAGSRDDNIYIPARSAESSFSSSYGKHILSSLYDHRFIDVKPIVYLQQCRIVHAVERTPSMILFSLFTSRNNAAKVPARRLKPDAVVVVVVFVADEKRPVNRHRCRAGSFGNVEDDGWKEDADGGRDEADGFSSSCRSLFSSVSVLYL
ncbi:hypothetical protein Ddye_021293 [Dipteronia dyeriana]|uniref:Uncharacterized protein n=1 Tax=Dipteronia dyeriana TaxID=168575 RepID=A0AAD9WXD9_9ROSI|nr:hypothetical protein Ddye_021293 [Dipteronia dyeriana]